MLPALTTAERIAAAAAVAYRDAARAALSLSLRPSPALVTIRFDDHFVYSRRVSASRETPSLVAKISEDPLLSPRNLIMNCRRR